MSNKYDAFLEERVGSIGAWQLSLFFFVTIISIPPVLQYQQLAFITPDHFCAQPRLQAAGWTVDEIINLTIPTLQSGAKDPCHQFIVDIPESNATLTSENVIINQTSIPCQHGWYYEDRYTTFLYSYPREFNLVCEKKFLSPMSGVAYMMGMLPGPVVGGFLADRYGRRNILIVTSLLSGIVSVAAGLLSTGVMSFWILRLLTGFFSSAGHIICFILCVEYTTVRLQSFYNLLYMTLGGTLMEYFYISMSYIIQEWRLTLTIITLPVFLTFSFIFLVPESPRWLATTGRQKDALAVLRRGTEINHRFACRTRNTDVLIDDQEYINAINSLVREEQNDDSETVTWQALFTTKLYLTRLICLMFIWPAAMNMIYTLTYFSVRLEGNPFVIACVVSTFAIPICLLQFPLQRCCSKRTSLQFALVVAVFLILSCTVVVYFLPNHIISTALATISYAAVYLICILLYAFTPPLFPTGIRNLAMGLSYGVSRVGAGLALFVERLDTITGQKWVPLAILASLAGVTLIVSALIPTDKSTIQKEFDISMDSEQEDQIDPVNLESSA